MSVSKWKYTEACDGDYCVGDCDLCNKEPEAEEEQMPKYINADELKIAINRNMDMQDLYLPYEFIELINEMPSADVVEVKHGEWETIDYDDGEYEFRCSNCQSQFDMVSKMNFCPNCGADMRGETE